MTKKLSFLLGIGFLSVTTLVWAQSDQTTPQPELRSSQVAMQARAGWMKSMNENLATMKYDAVGKDAAALSAQTSTVAEKQSNPLAKELTMKVSTLAKAITDAAGKQDSEAIKANLAEIKATCADCHARVRDKK